MCEFSFLVKEIWKGKSVIRSFLNLRLRKETLTGKTIDIGGGKNADYIAFMKRSEDVDLINFDIKAGAHIDFENDSLPSLDGTFDTVLFLNVMEHIFNYQHIANEVVRIIKPGGQLIGFVPFLMWYHADHKDFFRYTHEALAIILRNTGAKNVTIEPVALGPFTAAAQMLTQIFPKILATPLFVSMYILDTIFLYLRPTQKGRYALGYYFLVSK